MRAAANLLALCLLALTSLAARCQHGEAFTGNEQAKPLCKYSPRIQVDLYHDSDFSEPNEVSVAYGTEVKVHCLGIHAEKLTFSRNGKKIISDQSDHAITFKEKLDLQSSQYIFKCTDIETTCERSVNILVTPRFEVISPNVKTCFYFELRSLKYYVQYGNSVSVLCSGADATRLVMKKDGKTLPTERKNGTTIESVEITPDLQISEYACSDVDTTHSTSMNIEVLPNIHFQSQNETITPYDMDFDCLNRGIFLQKYYFQYSGSIEIFCSGPRPVKFMYEEDNDIILSTETYYNVTTVFINITKSGISEYSCADSESSDYVRTVEVRVLNRMEVVSPSARLVGIESGVLKYTILYGQPFEIVCSGFDASLLTIMDLSSDIDKTKIEVQAVNNSAIKYINKNNPVWTDFQTIRCSEKGTIDYVHSEIQVAVLLTVTNFHCVSYNLQFVNCTWTGVSNTASNTLYFVAYGIIIRICETSRTSRLLSKYCIREYEPDRDIYSKDTSPRAPENFAPKVLTFIIQSCSYVACYNQTFQFDHLSIVKLAPPEGLTVLRTTSRGAVLEWREPRLHFDYNILTAYSGDVQQIVQYWNPEIEWRDVNSSLVTCDIDYFGYCRIDLNLPCPDQFYEVRISHKLKQASEEFMSAPSSVTFYTDREKDNTINNDAACNQPVKTKEVMRYFVQELRKEMRPEIQPMKLAVRALREKLANIRKFIASIKEKDEK